MNRVMKIALAVVLGAVVLGAASEAAPVSGELRSLRSYCSRLDRSAADLVRNIERSPDYDRAQDTPLVADLTAFRTYVRGLGDVAAQAEDERRRRTRGGYRQARVAMRKLAVRLRTTAAGIESEMAQTHASLLDDWTRVARGDLDRAVAIALASDTTITPPLPPPPHPGGHAPAGFVVVRSAGWYACPASLKGKAKFIRIEAHGGALKVKSVKYTISETAFGYLNFEREREQRINRDVAAGRALLIQIDRGGDRVDVSKIQVEWEPETRRQCFGRVTLADTNR